MVFDSEAPPSDRRGFMGWYRQQTKWGEGHRYDNPEISTPELQAWFLEMITHYPMMNGPYAKEEEDGSKVTDYCVGRSVIYAGFAWSESEAAFETAFRLAQKYRVGFFNVSAPCGGIWLPDSDGGFRCVHGRGVHGNKKWWEFWRR